MAAKDAAAKAEAATRPRRAARVKTGVLAGKPIRKERHSADAQKAVEGDYERTIRETRKAREAQTAGNPNATPRWKEPEVSRQATGLSYSRGSKRTPEAVGVKAQD